MITGMVPSVQNEILAVLEKSDFAFELTGSRYFGCSRVDSDYDFFAEHTLETSQWLKSIGFETTWNYKDLAIMEVLVHGEGNIHVQLIRPSMMTAKRIAQEVFKASGYVRPNRGLWDIALLIAAGVVPHDRQILIQE